MSMSELVCIFSTRVALKAGESLDKVREIAQDCFDDYSVDIEDARPAPSDGTTGPSFRVSMDGADGYPQTLYKNAISFAERVGPMLTGGLEITIRTDTMSDERDMVVVAGPSPEVIAQFQRSMAIDEAIDALRSRAPELVQMLNQAKDGREAPPPVKVVVEVEGGLIQNVVASAPVDMTVCDYDTEGVSMDDLMLVFGNEARISLRSVEVDAEAVQVWKDEIASGEKDEQQDRERG